MISILRICCWLFSAGLIFSNLQATTIKTIYSMQEAQPLLDKADKNTLVVYDIDEVLIAFHDHIARFSQKGRGAELKAAFTKQVGDRYDYLYSKVLLNAEAHLVEQNTPQAIATLQARGVKTVALTKMRTGPYGLIPSRPAYRLAYLEKFGFNFKQTHNQTIEFKQLPSIENRYPMITEGVMFANFVPKGLVLGAFIDTLAEKPKEVIFFDDEHANHLSVQEELKKRNIPFHGFHYKALEQNSAPFDEKIAQFQLDHLAKHEVWLSEQEAKQLIPA